MELVLLAPDDIETPRLVRAYHAFCAEKASDPDEREKHLSVGEVLAENVSEGFDIIEDIPRIVVETYGGRPIYSVFESASGQREPIEGRRIIDLIQLLREAGTVSKEQKVGPDFWDPLWSMERRSIALCEFALENDYSVGVTD
ncbi:hypothetical protein SAMN04487950_3978 [Halogranum rubrum]|uniref:Uncharacterized protein n=1 Tax=Halogranum rubrum TaxID=553466 RepID=A0A1I4I501_9EURY|nr:hypothetical protein [Halogranum rubrum]SFL49522.1 hypothetical protein SAMN04487950_3978 [Halogranum rubrum]